MIDVEQWQLDAHAHALREQPREACGLLVRVAGVARYIACRNVAAAAGEFELHGEDFAAAEDMGEVIAVVHSHPEGPSQASLDDIRGCRESRLPWFILVDVETQTWVTLFP